MQTGDSRDDSRGDDGKGFPEEKLLWDAEKLEFSNRPEANAFLRRDYREGWQVAGLG